MKIIIDAMGGDNAPRSNVEGAVEAVRELGVEAVLVGRGDEILSVLKDLGCDAPPPGIEIVHTSEVVTMEDNPA
ncbi:MAG: phosphate--acyl-ACP acyltransferase, partial [Clostridiales bacterium]|nr:phosphate--acyl-ACP acyltransferase [Clostridiales bacterium]